MAAQSFTLIIDGAIYPIKATPQTIDRLATRISRATGYELTLIDNESYKVYEYRNSKRVDV